MIENRESGPRPPGPIALWTRPDLRVWRESVEQRSLGLALLASLIIHLFLYGGYRFSKHIGWWDYQPQWMIDLVRKKPSRAPLLALQKPPSADLNREMLLRFMDVDPALAAPKPPENAKHYGAVNAVAANPDSTVDLTVPKIDGQQDKVERVEDVPKPDKFPLMPAAPPEAAKPAELPREKPKPIEKPGDIALLRSEPPRVTSDGQSKSVEYTRPRTLQEARARKGILAGDRMKQDGGVRQRGRVAVDVKATAFGAYDAAFIAAVQERWYNLLDAYPHSLRSGKVVIHFRLMYDGRVTDLKLSDNSVGEIQGSFCQRAITDPSPYEKWPADMRRIIGDNYRDVTFTFYYN